MIDEINLSLNNETFFFGGFVFEVGTGNRVNGGTEEDKGAFAGFIVENADKFFAYREKFFGFALCYAFLVPGTMMRRAQCTGDIQPRG